jgi:hypothetical protein
MGSVTSGNVVSVAVGGNSQVTADTGAVTIGDQLVTSTTSGEVTVDNNATAGILGYATTSKSSGSSGLVGVYIEPTTGVTNPTFTGQDLFKNSSNSTTAFQIQDSSGASLLTADTTTDTITVQALVVTTNLTVNGHVITGGSTPGIAAGAASCTSPTVSIAGNDTAGVITVTTGTACASSGKLATVTFASAFGAAPRVNITPASAGSVGLGAYIDNSTISTTAFDLDVTGTPADSTTYVWNYFTFQ